MSEPTLDNRVRGYRDKLGLTQRELADRVGVTRQAIIGIEAGKQVPSTSLSLRLAGVLRCSVEDLFSLSTTGSLQARLAPPPTEPFPTGSKGPETRVIMGEVGGTWVAHRIPPDATIGADGIVAAGPGAVRGRVRPLADLHELRSNVLVSGCAPLLGALVHRVGRRHPGGRATWIPAGSRRSLELLADGLVHVAGVHLSAEASGEDNFAAVRSLFPHRRMLVFNLTRWREGLVVPAGNPLGIRPGATVRTPGLRFARREEGAGAHKLLASLLAREGDGGEPRGPFASGHAEVAQMVACGAADAGVAIESVALAAGLGFIPLTEERFDLVVPAELAETAPVSCLIDALDGPAFRAEIAQMPGYDSGILGHATTVEAA